LQLAKLFLTSVSCRGAQFGKIAMAASTFDLEIEDVRPLRLLLNVEPDAMLAASVGTLSVSEKSRYRIDAG
jgi:hypothetical protein